jgi:hypothetical protein
MGCLKKRRVGEIPQWVEHDLEILGWYRNAQANHLPTGLTHANTLSMEVRGRLLCLD